VDHGEAARREAHALRAECGAVLVGRATVEMDNPRLTVRALKVQNQPVRVVLDPARRLAQDIAYSTMRRQPFVSCRASRAMAS